MSASRRLRPRRTTTVKYVDEDTEDEESTTNDGVSVEEEEEASIKEESCGEGDSMEGDDATPDIEKEEESDEEDEEEYTPKRSSTRKKRKIKKEEPDDEEEQATSKSKKSKTKKRGKRPARGPIETRTCPHCEKVISTAAGLKYHVDNFVCRKNAKNKVKKAKSTPPAKKAKTTKKTIFKRIRGSLPDRTCPRCQKVFTSAHGCNYHVRQGVCKAKDKKEPTAGTIALPKLDPGSMFLTDFGVVQVISDDRQDSTFQFPPNIKVLVKKYFSNKDKRSHVRKQEGRNHCFKSLVCRQKLAKEYKNDNVNQLTVLKAYYGEPSLCRLLSGHYVRVPAPEPARDDPLLPPEAFPDRMVVCKPVTDERLFVYYNHDGDGSEPVSRAAPPLGSKLYLRRRDLNKPYNQETIIHVCPDCGLQLSSKEGFQYHYQNKVCQKRFQARGAAREESLRVVQERVKYRVKANTTRPTRRRKPTSLAMYPQVFLSLGFQLPRVQLKPSRLATLKQEEEMVHQDETLRQLQKEMEIHSRMASDVLIGAVYPSVMVSLGIRTEERRERILKRNNAGNQYIVVSRKRVKTESVAGKVEEVYVSSKESSSEESSSEESVQMVIEPTAPPRQLVDMQVLIDEVKTGRYPSIAVRKEGNHGNSCCVCKKKGLLLQCDFCDNAIHQRCFLSKIYVRDLELDEEFMCHACAGIVIARRNRAEKRRVIKQKEAVQKSGSVAEQAETKKEMSANEAAAADARELSEVSELLVDAQKRLRDLCERHQLNEIRRSCV